MPRDTDEYVSRADYDKLRSEYEDLFAALESEIEAHKATKEDADLVPQLTEYAEELAGKVRGRAHRDAYDKLADELGIAKDAAKRADLYKLAGWAEEGDEPDAAAMRKHFEPLLESRKYLLADAPDPRPLRSDDSPGRGPSAPAHGRFNVRAADLSNPEWMRANQERYADALADGSVNLID